MPPLVHSPPQATASPPFSVMQMKYVTLDVPYYGTPNVSSGPVAEPPPTPDPYSTLPPTPDQFTPPSPTSDEFSPPPPPLDVFSPPPVEQPPGALLPSHTPAVPPSSGRIIVADSSEGRGRSSSTAVIVGSVAGVLFLLLLLVGAAVMFVRWKRKRKRKQHGQAPAPAPENGGGGGLSNEDIQIGLGGPKAPLDGSNEGIGRGAKLPPEASPPAAAMASRPFIAQKILLVPTPRLSSPPRPESYFFSGGPSGSSYSGSGQPISPLSSGTEVVNPAHCTCFTYEQLVQASDGFSDANFLGQGGFGFVHKGVLLDGTEVAIKQLRCDSRQGLREFKAEVEIISRVHHKHLVSLLGYCTAGYQRLLVYEFVPNNTLEFHLHGKGAPTMEWSKRLKVAVGSAKGLAYLHEDCHPKIIHRDVKASNILLDFDFEAKVSDFGSAKAFVGKNTHVSTRIMGTFGYLAPEYASSGKLTEKSDVFSFGVTLLELITGHRPVIATNASADESLVDQVRPLLMQALGEKRFDDLVDPRLQQDYKINEMERMVACAASCVRHSARSRPQMSQIVQALLGNLALEHLNEGAIAAHSSNYSPFRKLALASQGSNDNE